jgi:site-specific recombinase XerD
VGFASPKGQTAAVALNHHAVLHSAAVKRAGIEKKIGWHTFRHTFSSLVKSLGVDPKVLQELVRHASIGTTMDVYTQEFEAPKRQSQQQLADLIMRTGTVGYA